MTATSCQQSGSGPTVAREPCWPELARNKLASAQLNSTYGTDRVLARNAQLLLFPLMRSAARWWRCNAIGDGGWSLNPPVVIETSLQYQLSSLPVFQCRATSRWELIASIALYLLLESKQCCRCVNFKFRTYYFETDQSSPFCTTSLS